MAWQEFILLGGSLLANVALVPTIRDPTSRVPFRTSALTTSILFVKTVMFVSLGMMTTALGVAMGTLCWLLILLLRSDWRVARRLDEIIEARAGASESSGTIITHPTDD